MYLRSMFALLTVLLWLPGCGFFASLKAQKNESQEQAVAAPPPDDEPFEMQWFSQEMNLSEGDLSEPVAKCSEGCKPQEWVKVNINLSRNYPWIVPSRIPSMVGPRANTEFVLSARSVPEKKSPAKSFSCTYVRVAKATGQSADYQLKSCTNGVKKHGVVVSKTIAIAAKVATGAEKTKSYAFGKNSVSVSCAAKGPALPPDPGEAGKATLEGIDSDKDGIRDDVQRWIEQTYPASAKTRAALRQLSSDVQKSLLTTEDKAAAISSGHDLLKSLECLFFVSGNFDESVKAKTNLFDQILNTENRFKAYMKSDRHFGGQTYRLTKSSERSKLCKFDANSMRN